MGSELRGLWGGMVSALSPAARGNVRGTTIPDLFPMNGLP